MGIKTEDRIEKNELLRQAGISSSELHNWVKRGVLPAYCGASFQGNGGSRYYYPAWAVVRASDIKRLRSQGVSMQKIRKILRGGKVEL